MHVPDGFLTNRIALSLDLISAATVVYAARRLDRSLTGRIVPTMGVLSAFVFAAQIINFPVLGGTSGHLVGGALLAILLGPMAGFLTMASVVIAQALFLQDGGLIALGANLFNIGAVTCWSGYITYRLVAGDASGRGRIMMAGFAAGWASLVLSAASCAFLLSASAVVPLHIGLPAMAGYHAIIGIVEGALTAGVLSFLLHTRPDLLRQARSLRGAADWVAALALVLIPFAILAAFGSSELPDPLQGLLAGSGEIHPAAGGSSGESLLSPQRLQSYLGLALILLLALVLAWFAGRLAHKGKAEP